jgi:hypothetical protein
MELRDLSGRVFRVIVVLLLVGLTPALPPAVPVLAAEPRDLIGPPGSVAFGTSVRVLANGNIVVSDPEYRLGGSDGVGAVYLYDGSTAALLSTLTGSSATDRVGSDITAFNTLIGSYAQQYVGTGILVLPNGSYSVHHQLVVGRPAENLVTLLEAPAPPLLDHAIHLPALGRPGAQP